LDASLQPLFEASMATAEQSLADRILERYDDLSRSERRLADRLLENPRDLATYSATELAGHAGVSKASAARLFKRLGYRNFREARRLDRQAGNASDIASVHLTANVAALSGHAGDLGLHLTSDLQNLIRTTEALRPMRSARRSRS
jgi:DNA-binding MurR/RpiR family transcriptional regulator